MSSKSGHGMAAFKQQELKAWQPVLTPIAVIGMLLVVFVIFLPIGIVLESCSKRVIEQSWRYDNVGDCDTVTAELNSTQLPVNCALEGPGSDDVLVLDADYAPPIYFYYELKNFYQNHRRFSKSKSDPQLRGDGNEEETDSCDPLEFRNDETIVPCGLFAGSFFEDRFSLDYRLPDAVDDDDWISLCPHSNISDACYFWGTGSAYTQQWNEHWSQWHVDGAWQKQGIAWKSDVDSKFKHVALSDAQTNQGPRQVQSGLDLPIVDDEDFIVWMRAAALPHFRKLHRVIHDRTLPKGTAVRINIASWFPTKDFRGEKWVTIAKTEWCGGANHALAWTYITVACVAMALTIIFAILLLFGSRKMADIERFAWHNRPTQSSLVSIA